MIDTLANAPTVCNSRPLPKRMQLRPGLLDRIPLCLLCGEAEPAKFQRSVPTRCKPCRNAKELERHRIHLAPLPKSWLDCGRCEMLWPSLTLDKLCPWCVREMARMSA